MANPGNLTDAQMAQLAQRIAAMADTPTDAPAPGVRQYVGARYVPLFATPIEWSDTREYEPLTIVLYQGNSYTSRQYVPTGIEVTNEEYWALTGNFNAQVEAYRQEVMALDERITANAQAIDDINAEINKLPICIIIGDSWSKNNVATWVDLFETEGTYRIKNYAGPGAGYIHSTYTPFPQQVQEAINDQSYNHDDVKLIVVFGGCNDAAESNNAVKNAANTVFFTVAFTLARCKN